ncbi:hypothetical protein AGABI2DRAFT_191243 [Agaricus bisporus var. bisporus H97]|uniref:hypothetical protein n=1 Tax=Agaricus bisporus var. bisporus (strain H97 / ATCC MYA-4626 / FGSC 10389) TaxID=936046 RepID=UPI00029F5B5E|nr:hypothetical protein AGABI2DRAFT_191243 [Agaricus bisporus var. bisporus H97]EKV49161.1 hypothetical protein AGABI2DRAFT_191243 [Agaricus bisporus var. bisporus H97]
MQASISGSTPHIQCRPSTDSLPDGRKFTDMTIRNFDIKESIIFIWTCQTILLSL